MEGCSRTDWWSQSRITEVTRTVDSYNNVECAWYHLSGKYDARPQFAVSAVCIKDVCPDCEQIFNALNAKNSRK